HRLATITALIALALAAAAPAARADVGETIIQRCTHGQSLGGFSQSDYRKALKELSADAEEYTDCASLIRAAQLAAAGGRGGAGERRAATPPHGAAPGRRSTGSLVADAADGGDPLLRHVLREGRPEARIDDRHRDGADARRGRGGRRRGPPDRCGQAGLRALA